MVKQPGWTPVFVGCSSLPHQRGARTVWGAHGTAWGSAGTVIPWFDAWLNPSWMVSYQRMDEQMMLGQMTSLISMFFFSKSWLFPLSYQLSEKRSKGTERQKHTPTKSSNHPSPKWLLSTYILLDNLQLVFPFAPPVVGWGPQDSTSGPQRNIGVITGSSDFTPGFVLGAGFMVVSWWFWYA